MSEILNEIEQAVVQYQTRVHELVAELSAELPKIFTRIFEGNPEIESMGWSQYSPYFNDGDECVFHVHEVDTINGEDVWDSGKSEEFDLALRQADDVLQSLPEDFLKALYGNHVSVTIHKDGRVETNSCDHD